MKQAIQKPVLVTLSLLMLHTWIYSAWLLFDLFTPFQLSNFFSPVVFIMLTTLLFYFVASTSYFVYMLRNNRSLALRSACVVGAVGMSWLVVSFFTVTWPPIDRLFSTHLGYLVRFAASLTKHSSILLFAWSLWRFEHTK